MPETLERARTEETSRSATGRKLILGVILSPAEFPKEHSNPSHARLGRGVSGNLCRSEDYNKILDSNMDGAEKMRRA